MAMPITVFGVEYPSLSAAARAFNLSGSTFHRYLKVYRVEPEPLVVCSKGLIYLFFIGPDSRAYYLIPDRKLPGLYTARQVIEIYRPDLLDAYDADNPTGEYRPYRKGGDTE